MGKTLDSAYRKILRLMGRGRDSSNNNESFEEFIRGKTFEFPAVSKSLSKKDTYFLLFQFVAPDAFLVKKDEYLIRNGAYLFKELVKSRGKNNPCRIVSLKELQKATNNFIADWIFNDRTNCRTYRGIIKDRHVAVKIPKFPYTLGNEIVSLSLIKHRNVVKLLGCCLETENLIVVHELPPNGTLRENIFHKKLIPPPVELLWTDRLRIATEIADALAYLHSELHMTHGCLWTAEAILLDEFHSAKLSTFDYSEIQNQSHEFLSDDETDNINNFGKRSDVLHFRNILLNLLGIRPRRLYCKVEIRKYFMLNVSEEEMLEIDTYIDLLLSCQSSDILPREEDEVRSIEEVARELRRIRSMINPQPTTNGNESDNLSSGAN